MNVLFLAAEANPFVKIGGLADVAGSLPNALLSLNSQEDRKEEINILVVIPFYNCINIDLENFTKVVDFHVIKNGDPVPVQAYKYVEGNVPVYFIKAEPITKDDNVYSSDGNRNREKFTLFSLAALELTRILNWKVDIIHANDWHTSLALYYAKTNQIHDWFEQTAKLLTIHNLPYLGGDGEEIFDAYGISELIDRNLPDWARRQFLPMGIWAADKIVAVSKSYAREILTPEYGCGLHEYLNLRRTDINGIVNGLDTNIWDPASDPYLHQKFSISNLNKRKNNKKLLTQEFNLSTDPNIPLIGLVTRIDFQKGIDLSIKTLQNLKDLPWQMILLGTGDPYIESELMQLQEENPDKVRILLKFDIELSHKIYGSADIFLMPSRYEPCGLAQMIAMHYGCVPVVHATGGLKDTVTEEGTGFLFSGTTPEDQAIALKKALHFYSNQERWQTIQANGMQQDFSWKNSARKYADLYDSLKIDHSSGGEK